MRRLDSAQINLTDFFLQCILHTHLQIILIKIVIVVVFLIYPHSNIIPMQKNNV